MNDQLQQQASRIELIIFDVDGVFTDGTFWYDGNGEEIKKFHTQDGVGIKAALHAGIEIAIISGRDAKCVRRRMHELGITHCYLGIKDKLAVFNELLNKLQIDREQIAYVGDDLPDLTVMKHVGLSIAVANATAPVANYADWQTKTPGGAGAVREVCDMVINIKQAVSI